MNSHYQKEFPPSLNPQVFAWLAALIGSACVGDYNAAEQNSIGNWLILVGQFILTTAAQEQLINNRNSNINRQQNGAGIFGSNYQMNNEIDFLMDAVNKLQRELNNLKK